MVSWRCQETGGLMGPPVGESFLLELGGGRRGNGGRRFFLFAGAVAGIDDDAGFFPGFEETVAGLAAAELDDEVVEIAEVFEEGGGVGLDFLEQGAAVDDLAAGVVEEVLEGCDGRREASLLPGARVSCLAGAR